ncbi:MAG: PilZ domain-containing protein [Desulfobacterales bacterium]|nr:PilZ domain-containing protein [Desulfobacterales bacterium]
MEKKRQSDRKALKVYLKVVDTKTGDLLGHAVDITEKGIMLTCEEPIEAGLGFDLQLELPAEIEGIREIHFSARSMWSAKDSETDFYNTGFEFSGLSERDGRIIDTVTKKYCF